MSSTLAAPSSWRSLPARARALAGDSLVRNSALLLLATVELAAGGFLFWQVVAHLFSVAEVGRASALISASVLIGSSALLGMHNSVIRYLNVWPDRAATVDTASTVVVLTAATGATAFVVVAPILAPQVGTLLREPVTAAVFVIATVGYAVGLIGDNVFVAARRSGFVLGRNTVVVVLRLVLPVACAGLGAFGVFTAYQGAMAAGLVLYLAVAGRVLGLRSRLRIRRDRLAAMWRYSAWNYLATVILMLPALLMPILVAERVDPAGAGYYYIASLIAGVLAFVPQATSRSFFAEAAHDGAAHDGAAHDGAAHDGAAHDGSAHDGDAHARAGAAMRASLGRVVRLTCAVQVPLLLAMLLGGRFALGLFGDGYAGAYPVLVPLALTQALTSVGFVGSTVLMIIGRLRLLCLLSAVASTAALVGAYLLLGRGVLWAGWSLLIGEVILAAIYLVLIRVLLRRPPAEQDADPPSAVLLVAPGDPAA